MQKECIGLISNVQGGVGRRPQRLAHFIGKWLFGPTLLTFILGFLGGYFFWPFLSCNYSYVYAVFVHFRENKGQ